MHKIGLFGGTFNPVHQGHIHFCVQCMRHCALDRVILIPANLPPHKEPNLLASGQDRASMLSFAAEELLSAGFAAEVSGLELDSEGTSYTVHTVHKLKKQFPQDQLYLLIGSDMFLSFTSWYRYEEILKEVTLTVGAREKDIEEALLLQKLKLERQGGRITLLPMEILELSSTEIRQRIQEGEPLAGLLPAQVIEYIEQKGLYGAGGQKNAF